MKKIADYRKLLGVTKATELKDLKLVYRNLMKEYHPDKFTDNEELKLQAEEKSKEIIEAYNFLLSIAPETLAFSAEEYNITLTTSGVEDYQYRGQILKISFLDGSSYEYFEVPKATYNKLLNADSPGRFIRRHISTSFSYRKVTKATTA